MDAAFGMRQRQLVKILSEVNHEFAPVALLDSSFGFFIAG